MPSPRKDVQWSLGWEDSKYGPIMYHKRTSTGLDKWLGDHLGPGDAWHNNVARQKALRAAAARYAATKRINAKRNTGR